jgi:branched-chain amino acid transport system ATP-binding protein
MPGNGYSVALIEHNWEFVLEVADFCYFLDEGRVAAFGTPDDVLGNRKVRERYLGR